MKKIIIAILLLISLVVVKNISFSTTTVTVNKYNLVKFNNGNYLKFHYDTEDKGLFNSYQCYFKTSSGVSSRTIWESEANIYYTTDKPKAVITEKQQTAKLFGYEYTYRVPTDYTYNIFIPEQPLN